MHTLSPLFWCRSSEHAHSLPTVQKLWCRSSEHAHSLPTVQKLGAGFRTCTEPALQEGVKPERRGKMSARAVLTLVSLKSWQQVQCQCIWYQMQCMTAPVQV